MKKRKAGRLPALALALTLLAGMLPAPALAAEPPKEQFPMLTPGNTYWFDLSGQQFPGQANYPYKSYDNRYVPFTYTGTISAYVLKSRSADDMAAMEDSETAAQSMDPNNTIGHTYDHSLFISDFNLTIGNTLDTTQGASWNRLNEENLIFGKSVSLNGVDYTLRVPSVGSEEGPNGRGAPSNNEWDAIVDKSERDPQEKSEYIKNFKSSASWGQDTKKYTGSSTSLMGTQRCARGGYSEGDVRKFGYQIADYNKAYMGFRAVLELPAPDSLAPDSLKIMTLDLNKGRFTENHSPTTMDYVYVGDAFSAPTAEDLIRPLAYPGNYFRWLGSNGILYAPGDQVPNTVTKLTAQWAQPYAVAVEQGIEHGSIAAEPAMGAKGTKISLTTTPEDGYELASFTVYRTGDENTTVTVKDNTFSMPDYDVTVTARFQKTADQQAVEDAKALMEAGSYTVAQATANTEEAVKAWLETTVADLVTGVTVADISVSNFMAAQADLTGSGGSDGSFTFTATLTKETRTLTTKPIEGTIIKTPYTPPERTRAPAFSRDTYTLTTADDSTAEFTLTNAEGGATYQVYPQAEGGEAQQEVSVQAAGEVLTLTFNYPPRNKVTFYISATAPDKTESARTAVAVLPFTAPASGEKQILSFTISGQVGDTVINQQAHTIALTMPNGTDLRALATDITVSPKAEVSPASGAVQDFTTPPTYTVTAEDGSRQGYTVTVTVQPPSVIPPTITIDTLPGGTVGKAYSQALTATGDDPIAWSVIEGSLPNGLTLSSADISGTPTVAGSFTFTIKAKNSAGSDAKGLSITIEAPAPTVTGVTVSPDTATVQRGTTQQFTAAVSGKDDPAQTVTWALVGDHASGTSITDGLLSVAADEAETTLTVKAASTVDGTVSGTATVTVTDREVTRYPLTVHDGTGSGDYAEGAEITVTAAVKAGARFKEWTASGIALNDTTANPITITMPAGPVELSAAYDDVYTVTVTSDGNGTGSAFPATAAEGEPVTLTAAANSGYRFKEWQVVSGGVGLEHPDAADTGFLMTGGAVEVKATFEEKPAQYTITFDANGGDPLTPPTAQTDPQGKLSSLPTPTRSGSYRFDGWFLPDGSQVTTDAVFTADTVITARWTYTGGGGGGNTTSPTEQAVKKVEKAGDGDNVNLDLPSNGKLPGKVLEAAAGKDITLEINAGKNVTWIISGKDIPRGKLSDLNLKVDAGADAIPVTVINKLTGEEKVMQLSLSHNGPFGFLLTLRLETGKENAGLFANLYRYNETDKTLEYQSTAKIGPDGKADIPFSHASSYAVVIDETSRAPVELPFTDVQPDDWYYEAVEYVYGAGLMTGVTDTTFEPNGAVTRAQVWTVLARLDGQDTTGGAPWYVPAQNWAVKTGVSDGTNPDGVVSREQLVTMLCRYAQNAGMDVSVGGDTNILSYTDAFDVAEWAVSAFQWACGVGIIDGTANNRLAPKEGAARAQMAAVLMRLPGGNGEKES